ncbi:MAG: hypothetical protein AVDCRST_MAG89-4156, partial [uncultured Gemmatimonadetes bacterium]
GWRERDHCTDGRHRRNLRRRTARDPCAARILQNRHRL